MSRAEDRTTSGGGAAGATNRLGGETSAYLRQHMHNPVDWFPWGDEALEHSRRDDKPLLLSIGYSACHWCHVMERESFEDPDTAALMNEWFVNVKVDREERPDVDRLYMDFVLRSQGQGGWPLTVFCTPDARPFFGGTYFPPEPRHNMPAFRQVLESIARTYRERRAEVDQHARQAVATLAARPKGVAQDLPGVATLRNAAERLLASADREHGGFGGAPKFPVPTSLDALLAAVDVAPTEMAQSALQHVVSTCREMSRCGLYDHLGGGFHRYCVDATWTIPHFEKMLYDQGQLLRTYAETWRRAECDPELEWPIRETAAYLLRELAGPEGGFMASQDADSEGVEGKFYVWTPEAVADVLGAERAASFCEAYDVTTQGNFEAGASHLNDRARRPRPHFAAEREALLAVRVQRVAPGTDPKRVLCWNGFAISGLARAGSALADETLVRAAASAADFILGSMRDERGRLLRIFDAGRGRVLAFLEDVAALLEACLDLHRAGAGESFLEVAVALACDLVERFWDAEEGDFYLSPSDGERLVHRPRPEGDGATPHAGGLAGLGLLRLAALTGREDWQDLVRRFLRQNALLLERAPEHFPTLARLAALAERGAAVAVIVGAPDAPDTRELAAAARRLLAPEDAVLVAADGAPPLEWLDPTWFAGRSTRDGRATAYLCRGRGCSLPVTRAAALDAALLASALQE